MERTLLATTEIVGRYVSFLFGVGRVGLHVECLWRVFIRSMKKYPIDFYLLEIVVKIS